MSEQWTPLPLEKPLFANVDASATTGGYQVAIENGFVTEQGGHSRFPGLTEFVTLPGENGRVYLNDFGGDLIAATSRGQVYRISETAVAQNVTGVPVAGGRRIIFAKSDVELYFAAGGPIVRLRDKKTEVLSKDAPLATHVGWLDGFTIAPEINSQRWRYCDAGESANWPALNSFSADGNPDNINSLVVTPFREILFGGPNSIEQFERLPTGATPFFKRWAVGDGVKFPYCAIFADNAMWTINNLTELVRFSGQLSQAASAEIGLFLESIDDWTDAWMGGHPDKPLHILGQKFLVIQAPRATTPYGTRGITLLYDYRQKHFSTLYGWDDKNGVPTRWPGWSHWPMWNKVFIGGEGKIYQLTPGTFAHDGGIQRWLVRTSHTSDGNAVQVKNLRLRVKRGLGTSSVAPSISVRCSRDAKPMGRPITRSLGRAGETAQFIEFGGFGIGSTFQFEIFSADNCAIELIKGEVKLEAIGH